MWVIKSAVDCGDGVSIEREQPSTAFRSMPHLVTFDGLIAVEKLNETTNVSPAKGESASIVHPTFRTGLINPDSMLPIDELTSSFIEKADLMRHAPKDSEYRPQSSIDVVTGKPDSTSTATEIGLQITGEGRRMNIWGNGGASTFEDRMTQDFDSNDVVFCNGIDPDIQRPTHPNDNISGNAGPGGSTYMTGGVSAPTDNIGINHKIQNGNIDQVTGNRFDQNAHAQDYWSAAAALDQFVQGANTGMIGKYHWSDLAEFGTASNMYKAAGIVNETYECTSKGMKNVWNGREERFNTQIDDSPEFNGSVDFNGDGHSGDAPTGDGCDGKPSLLDSAWEALKGWWEGDGDDKDSDDESTSDPNECFDMPWLNERYLSLGAGAENYAQNAMDNSGLISMSYVGSVTENYEQNFNDFSSQVPAFDYTQQVSIF